MDASELDYDLPEALIAQEPLAERAASRLMCVERHASGIEHRSVQQLPELMPPALLVLNDTKVIPARLMVRKPTGGRVELLLVERVGTQPGMEQWLSLGQTHKGIRPGMTLATEGQLRVHVVELLGGGEVLIELTAPETDGTPGDVTRALEAVGQVPLPPYIRRAAGADDVTRYQTAFAKHAGAVAAPTAGLHLSEALLSRLQAVGHRLAYVTLHVGPGTFAPLRASQLRDHAMHAERYSIPAQTAAAIGAAKAEGRPVVAVGTTVVRTLEASASDSGKVQAGDGKTSIFIYPPYDFRVVDALLTNFHLPRSTLLALVMAFAGQHTIRHAYAQAVAQRYRFFSYGDAMLIRGVQ